jgi:hypothetical protein
MLAGTRFAHSSGLPRVGLRAAPTSGLWPRPAKRRWLSCRLIDSPNFGLCTSHVGRVDDVKESRFRLPRMSPYPEGHGSFSSASLLWISDIGAAGRFQMKTIIRLPEHCRITRVGLRSGGGPGGWRVGRGLWSVAEAWGCELEERVDSGC